jgi:hypothetical protein
MKKIIITNKIDGRVWTCEEANDKTIETYLAEALKGEYGKPERWVSEYDLEEYEKNITHTAYREITTDYIDGYPTKKYKEYLLPADYEITIKDLTDDIDYLKEKIKEKIKKEVGTAEEQLDIIYEKGFNVWIEHRYKIDKDNPLL